MSTNPMGNVVLTGASTGIGRAAALLLDGIGYRVYAGVLQEQEAESLRQAASENLVPVILDVVNPQQIAEAARFVTSTLGPDEGILALVNNAGVIFPGPLEFLPLKDLRYQFEVNAIGPIAVSQAFLPLIRKGRGRIINVSTSGNTFPLPFVASYQASKTAQEVLASGLRRELLPWRIPVVTVKPLMPRTPMWDRGFEAAQKTLDLMPEYGRRYYGDAFQRGFRFMTQRGRRRTPPEESARLIVRAIQDVRPRRVYFARLSSRIIMGLIRLLPEAVIDTAVRHSLKPKSSKGENHE